MEWPPKVPKKFPLTPRKDGYCKTIRSKVRWICGKLTPKLALERYHERLRRGDFDNHDADRIPHSSDLTVKDLCNLYMEWLRQRVETGRPRKLGLRTFDDYRQAVQLFADTPFNGGRLASLLAIELTPAHFAAYALTIPGKSPYTLSRFIAPIRSMYAWAVEDDILQHPVKFGSNFKKPSLDDLRTARADIEKAFAKEDLWKIVHAAVDGPPAWLPIVLFCLNGASSNADLAKLLNKQVNLDARIIQFTRGKRGRAFRKFVLWHWTADVLRSYQRPKPKIPEYADHFFLTTRGRPYVRHERVNGEDGLLDKSKRFDAATNEFGKILEAAGVSGEMRRLSGMRTTFRTAVEAMPDKDNDAIDLWMGHPRRHISKEYVESFPVDKLHRVAQFVFWHLFEGWSCPISVSFPESSQTVDAAVPATA